MLRGAIDCFSVGVWAVQNYQHLRLSGVGLFPKRLSGRAETRDANLAGVGRCGRGIFACTTARTRYYTAVH